MKRVTLTLGQAALALRLADEHSKLSHLFDRGWEVDDSSPRPNTIFRHPDHGTGFTLEGAYNHQKHIDREPK